MAHTIDYALSFHTLFKHIAERRDVHVFDRIVTLYSVTVKFMGNVVRRTGLRSEWIRHVESDEAGSTPKTNADPVDVGKKSKSARVHDTFSTGDAVQVHKRFFSGHDVLRGAVEFTLRKTYRWGSRKVSEVKICAVEDMVGRETGTIVGCFFNHWGDPNSHSCDTLMYMALSRARNSAYIVEPHVCARYGNYFELFSHHEDAALDSIKVQPNSGGGDSELDKYDDDGEEDEPSLTAPPSSYAVFNAVNARAAYFLSRDQINMFNKIVRANYSGDASHAPMLDVKKKYGPQEFEEFIRSNKTCFSRDFTHRLVRHFGREDAIRVIHGDAIRTARSVSDHDPEFYSNITRLCIPEISDAHEQRLFLFHIRKGIENISRVRGVKGAQGKWLWVSLSEVYVIYYSHSQSIMSMCRQNMRATKLHISVIGGLSHVSQRIQSWLATNLTQSFLPQLFKSYAQGLAHLNLSDWSHSPMQELPNEVWNVEGRTNLKTLSLLNCVGYSGDPSPSHVSDLHVVLPNGIKWPPVENMNHALNLRNWPVCAIPRWVVGSHFVDGVRTKFLTSLDISSTVSEMWGGGGHYECSRVVGTGTLCILVMPELAIRICLPPCVTLRSTLSTHCV